MRSVSRQSSHLLSRRPAPCAATLRPCVCQHLAVMRSRGAGLLDNDIGDGLKAEWDGLRARPGESPIQPHLNASIRWTAAWKASGDHGNSHAWIALAILQASVGFLTDDVTL